MNRRLLPAAVFLGALLLTVAVLGVVRAVNNARNALDVAANQVVAEPEPLPEARVDRPRASSTPRKQRTRRRRAPAPANPAAAPADGGPRLSSRPTEQYLPSFQRNKPSQAALKAQRRKQRQSRIAAMDPEERRAFLEARRERRAARQAAREQGLPAPPPGPKVLDGPVDEEPVEAELLDTAEPPPPVP